MIRLAVDEQSLLRLRVATSPLWESISSLTLLARFRGEVPDPYTDWARTARRALPREVRDDLLEWLRARRGQPLPAFLTPIPSTPWPAVEDELCALRQTPAAAADPSGVDRFADLLEAYWHACLAPHWPLMRPVLEEEIVLLGRVLATRGPQAMLDTMGGRVVWSPPVLALPYQFDVELDVTGEQLLLVPVLFARGTRILARGEGQTAVSYQARGAAALGARRATRDRLTPRGEDGLTILVGRGRATVLRALVVPRTTTALAAAVGLASSTVSEHLTALTAAGVVSRRRSGPHVLYELNDGGRALLEHAG
ncbi:MAG: ArsR/SmtB family transcription factor [Micromonosporaceae bacterium]